MALLSFDPVSRWQALNLVEVYSCEITSRVLAAFQNIEAEAGADAEAYFQQKIDEPAFDDSGPDEQEIVEVANHCALKRHDDLHFVKCQVVGLSIAGLYHLWERILKTLFERQSIKIASGDFGSLINILTRYGWTVKETHFYPQLNILRLVANVIKHGSGPSFKELVKEAPEMFGRAETLELTEKDFWRFVEAVREFLTNFPEEF